MHQIPIAFVLLNAALISIFVGYNLIFVIIYPFARRSLKKRAHPVESDVLKKFAIIIPAHNEELMIGEVIESTKNLDYPKDKYEVIVIADNCTDKTAEIARRMSANCYERNDLEKRGKPYALDWVLRQIRIDDYDAFVIVDADTLVDSGFLKAMNRKLIQGAETIQGYFGIMNPDDSWLTRLAVIPGILKFNLRYLSKAFIGLSCPLMGNGMCFSHNIFKKYGWNAFSITENWEYYVKLVLNNHVPTYAEDAVIYSHAVISLKHGETQRIRWLKGTLQTSFDYFLKLLRGITNKNPVIKLDAAMELVLPAYAMLFNWTALILLLALVLWLANYEAGALLVWITALAALQVCLYLLGMVIARTNLKTWLSLFLIPLFLAWKFMVTVKGVLGLRNTEWEKTERFKK